MSEIKNLKISKNDIIKSFFIILLICLFALAYLNQLKIQFFINGFYSAKGLQVYYIDVGNANASVVVFPNNTCMIIDTGSGDSEDYFMQSIDAILGKNKISSVEMLVLTHSDEDHVGGTEKLLEKYQVYNIYRPKIVSTSELETENEGYLQVETLVYERAMTAVLSEPKCKVKYIEDISFLIGAVSVQIWATENFHSDTNAYSPFITMTTAQKTFMFTGDATKIREQELITELRDLGKDLQVDFLMVSHHGSKYSTTQEFLDVTKPSVAIISAGNDKNHPSYEVLDRLEESGCDTLVTKDIGTILININSNGETAIKSLLIFVDIPFLLFAMAILCFAVMNLNFNQKKFNKKPKTFFSFKQKF